MIVKRIKGANANPGAPKNFKGNCGKLPIRIEGKEENMRCYSAWQPTDYELKMLNEGGHIILTVCGWQVPVALSVETASAAEENI